MKARCVIIALSLLLTFGAGKLWVESLELNAFSDATTLPSTTTPTSTTILTPTPISPAPIRVSMSVLIPQALTISSGDGLSLTLTPDGDVASVAINDLVMPMLSTRGGFSFREVLTSAPNLIANPGFEEGAGTPNNWSFVTTDGNTPTWDAIAHSGVRSIKISIPSTSDKKSGYPKSDLIKAEPLQYYTLSAWAKTQGAGGMNTPTVRAVELDANKKWLRQTNLIFSNGTNDWTQKQITFQTGINTSWLYIYTNIWSGYGTFLDDIELRLILGPTIYLNGTLKQRLTGIQKYEEKTNNRLGHNT